MIDRNQRRIRG